MGAPTTLHKEQKNMGQNKVLPWTGLHCGPLKPPRELCSRMWLVLEPASVLGTCQMTSLLWMLILCCSLHIQLALSELAFSLQPEDGIGVLGAPLSMPCAVYDSQQQRALSVKWERVGGDAATAVTVVQDPAGAAPKVIYQLANGSLVFPLLRERHLGTYVCSANTGPDSIRTVVQVEKAGMEPVFFSPKSQRVIEGEGVFLQCVSGDSSPPAHITWLKDRWALDVTRGTQIQGQYGGGSQKKTTGTLHLSNVTRDDEGAYVCVTHNPLLNTSMESSSAMLTVLGVPRGLQITQGPQNITVALATKASMSCTTRGFPVPTVQWFKEDRLLTNCSGLSLLNNGQLLVWKNVSDEDEGLYYCEATNQRERLRSPPAYLLPAVMGWIFLEQPNNQTLKRGDSVTLVCRPPYSRPRVNVTWFRNNHVLVPKPHLTVKSSGDLHFFSVEESDNGVYFCRASSSHLHRSVTSRRVSLNVLAPPFVRLWPQVVTVTIGAPVRLLCQVSGNPLPTIRWLKQGRSMQTGGRLIVGKRNATLYILSVINYDEGFYTCEASNNMGSKYSTAMLRVAVSPIIVSPMGQLSCRVGSSVTLPCKALGVSPITYNWSRSTGYIQTPITSQQDTDINGDGALRISSLQWSDAGEYLCTAENKVGRQNRRYTLTVTADDDQSDSDEQTRQNLSAVTSPTTECRAPQPNICRVEGASGKTRGLHVSPHYRETTGLVPNSDLTNYTVPQYTSPREKHIEMTPDQFPMLPLDPPLVQPTLPSVTQIDPPILQPPYIYINLQHSELHTRPLLTNKTLLPSPTKATMPNTEAPPTKTELSQFLVPQIYSPVTPFPVSEGHSQGQIADLLEQHLELDTMASGFLTNLASPELYLLTVSPDQQNTLKRPSAFQTQDRDSFTETQGSVELISHTLSQPPSAQPQPPITQEQLTERQNQPFSTYNLLFQLHPLPTLTKEHTLLLNSPSQIHSFNNKPQPFATHGQLPLPKQSPTNTILLYTRSQASPTPIVSQPQPSLTPDLPEPHPSPTLPCLSNSHPSSTSPHLSEPHPSLTLTHLLQHQQSPTHPHVLQPPAPTNLSQPNQSPTPKLSQPQQSPTSPQMTQFQPSPTPPPLYPTHNHPPNTSPLQSTTAVINRSNLSTGSFTLTPFGPGVPETTSSSSFHQNTSLLANNANPGQSDIITEPLEWLKRNTTQFPMTSNDPRVISRLPSWLPVLEKHDVPIVVGVGVSLAFIFITMAFYSLVQKNEPVPTCRGAQRNHGVPLRHTECVAAVRTYENRAYEDDEMMAVIEQSPCPSDTRARPPLAPSLVTVQVEPASEEPQGDPQPSPKEDHQSVTVETYPEPSCHTPMECSLEGENACCLSQHSIQLQFVEDWGSLIADDLGSCQDVLPSFPLPLLPLVEGEGLHNSLTRQTAGPFSTPVHHSLSISHGISPLLLSHCISQGLTSVAVDVHFYPATTVSSTRVNSSAIHSSAAPSLTARPQLSSTWTHCHGTNL